MENALRFYQSAVGIVEDADMVTAVSGPDAGFCWRAASGRVQFRIERCNDGSIRWGVVTFTSEGWGTTVATREITGQMLTNIGLMYVELGFLSTMIANYLK